MPTSEQRGWVGAVIPELGCLGVQCPLSWEPLSGADVTNTQLSVETLAAQPQPFLLP